MPKRSYLAIIVLSLLCGGGCSEETLQKLKPRAVALGTVNQLTIISDTDLWENEIGDSIQYYFGSAFPLLPQPEPLFDLKHYTPEDIQSEPLRRELKAYCQRFG